MTIKRCNFLKIHVSGPLRRRMPINLRLFRCFFHPHPGAFEFYGLGIKYIRLPLSQPLQQLFIIPVPDCLDTVIISGDTAAVFRRTGKSSFLNAFQFLKSALPYILTQFRFNLFNFFLLRLKKLFDEITEVPDCSSMSFLVLPATAPPSLASFRKP